MTFIESMADALSAIKSSEFGGSPMVQRIQTEIGAARDMASSLPDKAAAWEPIILKAAETVRDRLTSGGAVDLAKVVSEAETILAPIGKVMKDYTIHCVGHAHIDMNWMWPWQETVSVSHDTFSTVDKLMRQFPEFKFSQSQASTYYAMEDYCPEIFDMMKERVGDGRWESTASMWVEGDKNLASGEILCRHMLYTRRYFKEKFGLPYDAVKIDWECDTFGHCHTLPSILNRGGVTRYYRHRTGPTKWLLWWTAPDGSKVLTFFDKGTYNGPIDPTYMSGLLSDYLKETGLKDFMFVYGVGDHGGGPTRRDLIKAGEIAEWPIFPTVKLSTTDAFFSAIEPFADKVPVFNDELNFVFEGCYTSESNIKTANRVSENVIPEVEAISLIAGAAAGFPYPTERINKAWRLAMFNQFHDILPGSGVHATYEYSQGLFQDILAETGAIRTRAMRRLASEIDTAKAAGVDAPKGSGGDVIGDGLGAGSGDPSSTGGVSAYNVGAVSAEPFIVFNAQPFPRSGVVQTKIWDKDWPHDQIRVRDESGNTAWAQVVRHGGYWGHNYATVVFPVNDVPAMGYKVYTLDLSAEHADPVHKIRSTYEGRDPLEKVDVPATGVVMVSPNVMENEFVRVEVDKSSGAVKHLIDKSTGYDYVPEGELLGVLEIHEEASNRGMSAWTIGDIKTVKRLDQGGYFTMHAGGSQFDHVPGEWGGSTTDAQTGPHRATVRSTHKVGDTVIEQNVTLCAGSPMVQFEVKTMWLERGNPDTVPMLRAAFPARIADPKATYEIAFGSISRPTDGHEVPALRWADLSGKRVDSGGECGITLVNADKYGHSADGNTLRLTLLRSSYEPDPLPEMGRHDIKFAIIPHDGACSISEATRQGASYNVPLNIASTDVHKGSLPAAKSFVEVLNPNIMLAGIKKAEDSDALIVRVYEVEGKATEAKIKLTGLTKPGAKAVEVDLMEEPLPSSSAKMDGDALIVKVPAFGIASVRIG